MLKMYLRVTSISSATAPHQYIRLTNEPHFSLLLLLIPGVKLRLSIKYGTQKPFTCRVF